MEILGNNSLHKDNSYLNLYSGSQINALQDRIRSAQANITKLQSDLTNATDKANYCENLGWLQSCKNKTGKTTNEWRRLRDSLNGQLTRAKIALATAQKAYNDAIAANKAEESMKTVEHQADVAGQAEMQARGKSVGIWGVVILVLAFGGLYTYKRFKK